MEINNSPQKYKLIYMSVKQFAAHKGEHPVTIERKILAGIIKSEQDAPRCQHKIPVRIRIA